MAVIKCKMCGGDLNVTEGSTVVECEYCGCKQTIPNLNSERKLTSALPATPAAPGVESLLKRAWMFLEDREWKNADAYFDKVLDIDPECARAYAGKVCAEREKPSLADMAEKDSYADELEASSKFRKALRFADSAFRAELEQCLESVKQNQKLRREEEDRCRRETIARLKPLRERAAKAARFIAAGFWHTVGLKSDGTVVAAGDQDESQCAVTGWRDIAAVAANAEYTLGLKSDGTVVATEYTGKYDHGQCNVAGWRNIVAVAAGFSHAVGLRSDGTVVAVGDHDKGRCDVDKWTDIVAISAYNEFMVGLKSGGTVIAVGDNQFGQCNVSDWRDIVAVSAGGYHTVGLKPDGTVVAVGDRAKGQCNVSGWRDIVAISAGHRHTVGLKSDGTVVFTGKIEKVQRNATGWQDIVAVAAGSTHTVSLKSDGTVAAVFDYYYDRRNPKGWKLFNSIDTLEHECKEAQTEHQRQEAVRQAKIGERQALQTELAGLKGLFTGKRRKEIVARLEELEAELNSLK